MPSVKPDITASLQAETGTLRNQFTRTVPLRSIFVIFSHLHLDRKVFLIKILHAFRLSSMRAASVVHLVFLCLLTEVADVLRSVGLR